MYVKLIAMTESRLPQVPTSEQFLEYCGRVCWRTDLAPDSTEKFIKALIRRGHHSVIEHSSASFEIGGISRSCSHQIVRHRLASYSQESMRYVSMDAQEVVMPPDTIGKDAAALKIFERAVDRVQWAYRNLRDLGIPKQDARFILPIGTMTRLVMTQNLRSWRHFCELRCSKHAQWEIRAVANAVLLLLHSEAPTVFADLYEQFTND